MAPSHEIFVTIENILKSPYTLTAVGISISSLILFFVFARKSSSTSKSTKVRSNNNRQAANRQQTKSTATKKLSEAKKGGTPKQASAAKPTSDKIKKEQQSKQQTNKKNKEAETKKKEAENKKGTTQLERKIKVAEANPRQQLNDRSQNKDDGGWIKLVSRREKRERSAKLKELKAGEQGEMKAEEVSKAGEKKPYRGTRDGVKRSTPFQKRT